MLFALIDYWYYKHRTGPYSIDRINEQGGKIAVKDNFPLVNNYGAGTLFLYHGCDSILSWLVMYYTSSIWSHTASFTENGMIVDATTSGVIEHHISDYFDGNGYICIMTLKEDIAKDFKAEESIEFARNQVGKRYNWQGVIRLFISIITGSNANYRFRVSGDILILLSLFLPFYFVSEVVFGIIVSLIFIYVILVLSNTEKRNKMRRELAQTNE